MLQPSFTHPWVSCLLEDLTSRCVCLPPTSDPHTRGDPAEGLALTQPLSKNLLSWTHPVPQGFRGREQAEGWPSRPLRLEAAATEAGSGQ